MSDRKWPVSVMGTRWLTYCPHDGWDEHDAPEEAESAFGAIVEHLSDESADGWYESADRAAWGVWLPIERLCLVATAWSDDDSGDGERCRDAGWDAFLDGVVQRVEPDAAALEFCIKVEAAAHKAAREEIARLRAEVDRLRRILAVEQGDESAAPDGWHANIHESGGHCVGVSWRKGTARVDGGATVGGWGVMVPGEEIRVVGSALEAMEAADRAAQEVSDV